MHWRGKIKICTICPPKLELKKRDPQTIVKGIMQPELGNHPRKPNHDPMIHPYSPIQDLTY
jgi:hypothetical protein